MTSRFFYISMVLLLASIEDYIFICLMNPDFIQIICGQLFLKFNPNKHCKVFCCAGIYKNKITIQTFHNDTNHKGKGRSTKSTMGFQIKASPNIVNNTKNIIEQFSYEGRCRITKSLLSFFFQRFCPGQTPRVLYNLYITTDS